MASKRPQLPLVLPTPTRLSDTVNMTFGIPTTYYKQPRRLPDGQHDQTILLHTLLDTLSAFTLYPWSELETDYAIYSNKSYNIMRHLDEILLSREAEFTGKGLSPYDGYGRLWYDPPTMIVEWDACWDMRFTPYRTKGWVESPVVSAARVAAHKAEDGDGDTEKAECDGEYEGKDEDESGGEDENSGEAAVEVVHQM
jgi:hypothetical protein